MSCITSRDRKGAGLCTGCLNGQGLAQISVWKLCLSLSPPPHVNHAGLNIIGAIIPPNNNPRLV